MKRMKKVMLLMGFMAFAFFTQATEWRNNANNNLEIISLVKKLSNEGLSTVDRQFSCTVTQKASLTVYFVTYEISCSATASSCTSASSEAMSCVKSGIAQIKQAIK